MHIFAQLRAQIDDRINHHLPRSMISHIAAAARAVDRNFLRREYVRFLAAATDSVDMGVLDEKKGISNGLALLGRDQLFLNRQRRKVIHRTQVSDR